ncbi:DNA polymerase I [Candidatus Saccharibacteria bacterium]|nr:DNA polymerase I [Candidatus Saccharibacteria bacterium]
MKRLAVIDGKSLFYRGYYAMPYLSLPDGTPTGGVFGFASIAIELIKKLEPDYVAVAWDKPKTNIRKRREIYPDYKKGRKPAPDDFYAQIPILMELLDAFGWPFYELDDYEADDILGAFAKQATEKGVETYLLTSDLDALQLVGPMTKVYAIKNGLGNIEEFDVEAFEKKYGIEVEQFLDLKSLKGDSSDNIPGVPGVGEKTAVQLLQDYGTLDAIYEHLDDIKPTVAKKLEAGKELAYISKQIARIWVDAPVELDWGVASIDDIDLPRIAEILERLQFHSLTKRLPKYMQTVAKDQELSTEPVSQMVGLENAPWPDTISIDGPAFVEVFDSVLWLSLDGKMVFQKPVSEVDASVWRALEWATVVSYDVKALYHVLADSGIFPKFQTIHDLRHGAFLIDPLRRDRSVAGLIGEEASEPEKVMAGFREVYQEQQKQFEELPSVKEVALNFDFPLTSTLFRMERRGVRINPDRLEELSNELGAEHQRIEQEMYTMVGHEFNIGSPAQLSQVLFTDLELPTSGIKKGKTAYSTGQAELDKLRGKHPIIELIEKTRELAKLKNTYTDALPKLADTNNRIHSTFNQDVAATGRLSSTQPNLQNIPIRTEQGRRIREAFVADEGNVLVSADYSQFELRLAAVLADDKELIEDFNNSVDVHTKTASDVYGVPLEEVTKDQRRDAKVINFGVLYGMSPHGLAANTGMSFTEAKQFIDSYFELRAPVRAFIDDTLRRARELGYVETFYGRRRPTPDVHSTNFAIRSGAERAAANMPIQGTEADLMKRAMLQVDEKIEGLGEQILQIHDSILVECSEKNAGKVAEILKTTMEAIAPELPVLLKVDVSIGKSWGEL